MTISSTIRQSGPYLGTGLVSSYPFAFKVFANTDVQVVKTVGADTVLTLGSDYLVTLNANQDSNPGGVVNLTSPLGGGEYLTIGSQVPNLQGTDITNAGGFLPQVIEDALDKLTILIQQLGFNAARTTLRVPEVGGVPALPPITGRADNLLGFDSAGNPVAVAPVGGSAAALATDLTSSASATKGAGQIGFGYALGYGAGTIGRWLKDLALSTGAGFIGWIASGANAVLRTVLDKLRDTVNLKDFWTSGDITTGLQAACTAVGYRGRVVVSAGTYTQSGTVTIPMGSFGSFELVIEAGATINYTGAGYAFNAATAGTPYANVNITGGGEIIGTATGLAGIRYHAFNKGRIEGVRCRGFINGSGILIDGANCIDMIGVEVSNNKYGIRLVSVLDGVQYAANGCRVIGGHVSNNSVWGIYDDATGAGGTNLNNVYSTCFDPNGSNTAGTGNIFIQGATGCVISSYLESAVGQYGQYTVTIGDATYHPVGTVVENCIMASMAAVTATIYDNGTGTLIQGNTELGNPTSFILGGANGVGRMIGRNYAPSVGSFHSGTDNGDTLSIGNSTSTLANSMVATVTGTGFKTLCGNGAPLNIRARAPGDTTVALFKDYGGTSIAGVTTKGAIQPGAPSGAFGGGNGLFQGTGVPSNADGASGDIYFRVDTPGTANQRIYIKNGGAWVGIV